MPQMAPMYWEMINSVCLISMLILTTKIYAQK